MLALVASVAVDVVVGEVADEEDGGGDEAAHHEALVEGDLLGANRDPARGEQHGGGRVEPGVDRRHEAQVEVARLAFTEDQQPGQDSERGDGDRGVEDEEAAVLADLRVEIGGHRGRQEYGTGGADQQTGASSPQLVDTVESS